MSTLLPVPPSDRSVMDRGNDSSLADPARTRGSIARWLLTLGAGLLAGLVAVLLMTVVMALLRWGLGISPPPESVPDRLAPTFNIPDFFRLINQYGGYNGLKRFGVWTGIRAMIGAGTALGIPYAVVTELGRRRTGAGRLGVPRAGLLFVGIALALVWGGSLIFLWPVLTANYRGLPPSTARPVSAAGLLLSYASFGAGLIVAYRFVTGHGGRSRVAEETPATAEAPHRLPPAIPTPRRALLTGAVGAALGFASYRLIKRLESEAVFPYDGTRPRQPQLTAITPVDQFYVVTKNVVDPRVIKAFWRLEVMGHVDQSHTYDFDALTALPATTQETTLTCISNQVGDTLLSTAVWKGVPMRTLLAAAGPKAGALEVYLHGADGYTDTFPFETAMDPNTLVAYEMNGQAPPDRHGYPVRLIVPGFFGEKNVKWVTGIEVVDHPVQGFYEQQGWGPNFVVPTRSQFYTPALNGPIKVGADVALRGLAFAGNRGVTKVEISLDDGKSWQPAAIESPGTKLSWALWTYDWRPAQPGDYRLAVRATDGTGTLQTPDNRGIVPQGATGYHRVTAHVVA